MRTYYYYDGTDSIGEINNTDRLITYVTFGPNGLISRRKGTNSTFYTYDMTGTVATATDCNRNMLGNAAYRTTLHAQLKRCLAIYNACLRSCGY